MGESAAWSLRLGVERPDIEFVGINSHSQTPDYMAYLLKYDSVHGRFQGQVSWEGDDLIVNGRRIRVFHCEEPHEIPWASVGAEYIVESTGKFTTAEKMKGTWPAGPKGPSHRPLQGRYPHVRHGREQHIL